MSTPEEALSLQGAFNKRREQAEKLTGLIKSTSWLTDLKLSDILSVLAFFHTQHSCYLEVMGGQSPEGDNGTTAFHYEVIANTLISAADFKRQWPEVTLNELYDYAELFEEEGGTDGNC